MISGIPVEIPIAGELVKVYFATRRFGKDGDDMSVARDDFHRAQIAMSQKLQRIAMLAHKSQHVSAKSNNGMEQLMKIADQQNEASTELVEIRSLHIKSATEYVRHSLTENYGPEGAQHYMSQMTDKQIIEAVSVIETGEVPEDFFESPATRQKSSDTSPGSGQPSESSLRQDSPGSSGAGEKSATRTRSSSRGISKDLPMKSSGRRTDIRNTRTGKASALKRALKPICSGI